MQIDVEIKHYDWDGWELDKNPFGDEFDGAARERMIQGGQYLKEFAHAFPLGQHILELGPFFNPLVVKEMLNYEQKLIYIENDEHALKWISENRLQPNIHAINFDLNTIETQCFLDQMSQGNQRFQNIKFDTVFLSQILNYIDYVTLFEHLKRYLNPNAKIFINNVVHYGIPEWFHTKRPKSISETIIVLLQLGFKLIKQELKPSPREIDDHRLLLCIEYTGE